VTKPSVFSLEHIAFEGRASNCPEYIRGPVANSEPAIDQDLLPAFIARVLESAGLPADAYRAAPMRRRLGACLRTLKAGSVSEAWSLMQSPELVGTAIDSLLIGVTEFFRDAEVFDALRKIIATEAPIQQGPIRVWSAGCSNGAELYSLAMLLAEAGKFGRSILVGTDCRAAAIHEARSGVYSEADVRSMDAWLRHKYMHKDGGRWRVADSLRRHIRWRVGNLLAGGEDGPWDIILWRNMAIYLKLKSASQVWAELIEGMRPGGLLVVGKAERPPASSGLTCISRCIYRLQREGTKAAGFQEKLEISG
jgi:chemotaxis protein methyltransferase CheR